MRKILSRLRACNPAMYWYGWLCAAGSLACLVLMQLSRMEVNGLPAALKPLKFFLSIWITVWTLGWISSWLGAPRALRQYTVATIAAMSIELLIICGQAARGRMSHFNADTVTDRILFYIMGAAITAFTVWTAVIAGKFFLRPAAPLPRPLLWGIRIGLIAFVIFGLEGGIMGSLMRHSVGGPDDAGGLPLLHWSTRHGDLRIAHFLGLHSLQVLPLAGWIFRRRPVFFWLAAVLYPGLAILVLARALMDLPL